MICARRPPERVGDGDSQRWPWATGGPVAARQAEDAMEMLLDPAALGGLAGLIAVTGWAIGRAQGGLAGSARGEGGGAILPPHGSPGLAGQGEDSAGAASPREPAPCQQRALEERLAELARPFALADLHAEASAIRRNERILGLAPGDPALIVLPRLERVGDCRFIGLSGRPTCPEATRTACPHGGSCHSADRVAGAQGPLERL